MASRVVMPKLTDTMEEGVLLAWKKHEGDRVQAGEVIAEIETDKAVMDLEAFAPGVLRKLLVQDGETVQSGKLIAVIAEADEDIALALSDGVAAAPSAGSGPKPVSPRRRRRLRHQIAHEGNGCSPLRGQKSSRLNEAWSFRPSPVPVQGGVLSKTMWPLPLFLQCKDCLLEQISR